MPTILDVLTEKITQVQLDKGRIRDRLHHSDWNSKVTETATLNDIAGAIEVIKTYPLPGTGAEARKIELGPETPQGISYTIPEGFHAGTETILWVDNDAQDEQERLLYTHPIVTPKKNETVTAEIPQHYWGLAPVVVAKIPDPYHDVSSVNLDPNWVLPTGKYVDKYGKPQVGNMAIVQNDPALPQQWYLRPNNRKHTLPVGKYYYSDVNYTIEVRDDDLQQPTFTPSESKQELLATTSNKFISKVTVNPIPDTYVLGQTILDLLDGI